MTGPDDETCANCGVPIPAMLPLCARCGTVSPEHRDSPLCLVLRSVSPSPAERRRTEDLLADGGEGLDREEVRRQLAQPPALFRVPASEAVLRRLAHDLTACGCEVDLYDRVPPSLGQSEFLQSLWSKKSRLIPYVAAAVMGAAVLAKGWFWPIVPLGIATWLWWLADANRFLRRMTLRSALLARRLDVVPEEVARPIGVLLRSTLSEPLRSALGAMLVEHGRLLAEIRALAGEFADLGVSLRDALAELSRHATSLGQKAVAIEQTAELEDPELPARLARLRSPAREEIERRVLLMDVAQEERQVRAEWLRDVHATLVVRLEAIVDTLRSLRQRAIEARVVGAAGPGAEALDRLLIDVRRELSLVAETAGEIERVDRGLAQFAVRQ